MAESHSQTPESELVRFLEQRFSMYQEYAHGMVQNLETTTRSTETQKLSKLLRDELKHWEAINEQLEEVGNLFSEISTSGEKLSNEMRLFLQLRFLPPPTDDDLREDLRLHLLRRAVTEIGHQRPHQYAYSNDLLDELVRTKPKTENALRSINGMGPWRMDSSEEILRIIDECLMRRCVHAIQSNMELFADNPESEASVPTPQVMDDISEHFVEWARGRDEAPKRISTVEAKQKILEVLDSHWKRTRGEMAVRVSELRDGLTDVEMRFSPSRLSQIITSMVEDGLIVRKKPVPFERGVVILELTDKGLQEARKTPAH